MRLKRAMKNRNWILILTLISALQLGLNAQEMIIFENYATQENLGLDSILNEEPDTVAEKPVIPGTVKLYANSILDSLVEMQRSINVKNCPDLVRGYSVQIYSCSGVNCLEKANQNYNQFLFAYPSIPAKKVWDPPSHKVRVGNCRNRFEAEKIKAQIKEDFPFIFIVPDYIASPYAVDCQKLK